MPEAKAKWAHDASQSREVTKTQFICRLFPAELEKLKAKVVADRTSRQRVIECLIREYIKDNPAIMKLVKQYTRRKDNHRGNVEFDPAEAEDILHRLESYSPLQDSYIPALEAELKKDLPK